LPRDDEGFVVRFSNGLRLKLKGAEYRRIHALISRCTPLAMWEAMAAGDDMGAIRRDLPEEFWTDFDDIVRLLTANIAAIEARIAEVAASVSHLSDKELGLSLNTLPADVRPYLFAFRKSSSITGKFRDSLMRSIRPAGNVLAGYVPSYAMGRVLEDAAS
jgi:RNA ligase